MASPSQEVAKTEFKENYNVVKILSDKTAIMKQLQSFNSKNQVVAFGVRKQHHLTIDEKLDLIMDRLDKIETRLDNIVKLNNLKE